MSKNKDTDYLTQPFNVGIVPPPYKLDTELMHKIVEFSRQSPTTSMLPAFLTLAGEIDKLKEDIGEIKTYLFKQEEDKHKPTYDKR